MPFSAEDGKPSFDDDDKHKEKLLTEQQTYNWFLDKVKFTAAADKSWNKPGLRLEGPGMIISLYQNKAWPDPSWTC